MRVSIEAIAAKLGVAATEQAVNAALAEPDEAWFPELRASAALSGTMLSGAPSINSARELKRVLGELAPWPEPSLKAHVVMRAEALGLTNMLPASWKVGTAPDPSAKPLNRGGREFPQGRPLGRV
jgi:hypothetical protein